MDNIKIKSILINNVVYNNVDLNVALEIIFLKENWPVLYYPKFIRRRMSRLRHKTLFKLSYLFFTIK